MSYSTYLYDGVYIYIYTEPILLGAFHLWSRRLSPQLTFEVPIMGPSWVAVVREPRTPNDLMSMLQYSIV